MTMVDLVVVVATEVAVEVIATVVAMGVMVAMAVADIQTHLETNATSVDGVAISNATARRAIVAIGVRDKDILHVIARK